MPNSDMRDVAEKMGVPTALELMKNFGGQQIYIPAKLHGHIVREYAKAHPDKTVEQIARDLHLCKKTVYNNL